MPYVSVADVTATAKKAVKLGGKQLSPSDKESDFMWGPPSSKGAFVV